MLTYADRARRTWRRCSSRRSRTGASQCSPSPASCTSRSSQRCRPSSSWVSLDSSSPPSTSPPSTRSPLSLSLLERSLNRFAMTLVSGSAPRIFINCSAARLRLALARRACRGRLPSCFYYSSVLSNCCVEERA
jgi:hypothetical protein